MSKTKFGITSTQKFFTYLTFFSLFFSGLIWIIFNFQNLENFRPVMTYALQFHGAASFGFLIIFGIIIANHIPLNWKIKRNRRNSGIILTIFLIILILSGYLLYYLGSEEIRNITSYIHQLIGIFCGVIFVIHLVMKSKKQN